MLFACAQVVVNGFAAASSSYYFVQEDLSKFTRTCSFDPRGSGQSTWPLQRSIDESPDFGFKADALDVKLILDTEFEKAEVPINERTAILASHSRGWIVSVRFRADHESEFKRVVVASYDGSYCNGQPISSSTEDDLEQTLGLAIPEGTVRYGIAPIMPFLGGVIDLGLAAFGNSYFIGQDTSSLHPTLIDRGILPASQKAALVYRLTTSRFWERNVFTRTMWETGYHGDGPSLAQCEAAHSGLLFIPTHSICVDVPHGGGGGGGGRSVKRYVAQHTSLIQLGPFAKLATTQFRCFLNHTLNGGPSCAGIVNNGKYHELEANHLHCGVP